MRLSQKHCSDEVLLAHLDGELSPRQQRLVARHLKACWYCRSCLDELENQALATARALTRPDWPSPARLAAAKIRLLSAQSVLENKLARPPRLALLPARRMKVAAAVVCAVVAFATLGIYSWSVLGGAKVYDAEEVLARASLVEALATLGRQTIVQAFVVQVQPIKPLQESRSGRITIWSDPSGERFAGRWTDDEGNLRKAVWRGGDERQWVYDAHESELARRRLRRASPESLTLWSAVANDLQAGEIEDAVWSWLLRRSWQPVSISRDFALLGGENGEIMRVIRVARPEGAVFRITTVRSLEGEKIELSLEVDSATFNFKRTAIRMTQGDQVVELRLILKDTRRVSPGGLQNTIFEPDPGLLPRLEAKQATPPTIRPERREEHSSPPSESELLNVEIEARYLLHRASACLGEPVSIEKEPDRVVVHGVAETEHRRTDLLAALRELAPVPWVTVEIKTVEEKLVAAMDSSRAVASQPSELRVIAVRPPVEPLLERYLNETGNRRTPASELSSTVVTGVRSMMLDAWALRRLVESSHRHGIAEIRLQSRWLLEIMVRDHLQSIAARSESLGSLLGPVLDINRVPRNAPEPARFEEPGSWEAASRKIFDSVERLDRRVIALFVGRETSSATSSRPEQLSSWQIEADLSLVWREFSALSTSSLQATVFLAMIFSPDMTHQQQKSTKEP